MYTILRLKYKNAITYLMILTNKICNSYDFLTYDTSRSTFLDESFTVDSFITCRETEENVINIMIEKIGSMIEELGLEYLMYNEIKEYENMSIESIHVPEGYYFKYDETLEIL